MGAFARRPVLAALPMLAIAARARAQAFPTRTIAWVVPFTPGGITDTSARLVAQPMGGFLGQQVIIENRPGAGGAIGTEAVARANPDGYTVLYGTQGTMATNPVLYRNLRYDALRDFVPVHGLTQTPLLLVCNAERPWRTLAEFIAFARAKPAGEVTYATSGIGTGTHMAGELFQLATGVKMTQVPYTGSAPALNDLVAGRTDIMFDYVVSTRAYLQGAKLRPLAMTGPERFATLPDVPTMAQAGLPEAETVSWSAMMAPAATPPAVVARLAEGMRAGLSEPRVVQTLTETGSTPLMMSGEGFRRFVAEDIARWRQVVERAGVSAG